MLQVLIKETFIDSILNSERAFLLYIDKNHKVWLRADMEYGGDPPRYRVELMNFNLDIAKPILYTTVECRGFYCRYQLFRIRCSGYIRSCHKRLYQSV